VTRRRLLSISHSYVIGLNRRLPNELARLGGDDWEVTVVAPRRFDDQLRSARYEPLPDERCDVRAIDVHLSSEPHVFFWSHALSKILRQPWDVVHLWEEPYVIGGIQPALMTPRAIPLVFATFQNITKHYPFPFGSLERTVLSRAAGWIAYGETVARAQIGRKGYSERPVAKIPPAVDVDLFRPDRALGASIRRQLGWSEDGTPTVGYLGRLVSEKGLSLLTDTLDQMQVPWRALIVGTGPLERELREWMKRYPGRCSLMTSVRHAEVPGYMNAMDVVAVPSRTTNNWREQFGRVVVEAFACGIPVIASDSGELPFTVGDAGVIVHEGDGDAWARRLQELLRSPETRRDLGVRGRDRATSQFAWPLVARKTLDFLSDVAHRSRRQG
jgi:glycosyltransferase involved in cell wall biosynthesis